MCREINMMKNIGIFKSHSMRFYIPMWNFFQKFFFFLITIALILRTEVFGPSSKCSFILDSRRRYFDGRGIWTIVLHCAGYDKIPCQGRLDGSGDW